MKKHLHNSLRALFLSLSVLLSLPMLAKSVRINGINYDLVAESKEAAVISKSGDKYSGEVVIPESVEHEGTTYSVTSIGSSAFYGCSGLTSVTIPNSVTSIGESAFYGCINLTSVVLPNNLTRIERRTFYNCSSLNTITIPNTVRSIGVGAIYGCKSLNSIIIPPSVTLIEEYAFQECTGLSSVHISDLTAWCNITFEKMLSNPLYLAGHLFLNGKEIKDLIIPSGVTKIGYAGFCGGAGFTSVSIPNSVTSIGEYAFYGCSGLTSVTIPNSVTRIEYATFYGCSGLTLVTIPNSVTSIGDDAFYRCTGLTSVTIGNCVKSIGRDAFRHCSGWTSVTIGSGVENIDSGAFDYCPDLIDVYCYAEKVPSFNSYDFYGSNIENAILHVPAASIESYKTTEPWSSFGTIKALPQATTLVVIDGEEFENDSEQMFNALTYTRTLPNMLWNPLYVPFKIPYEALEENYEVAYINAMHSYDNDDNGEIDEMIMEIVKIKAGTLKPNHPYLIKAKNEKAKAMSIVLENATLYPTEITTLDCSSVYTKFTITGTYQEMTSSDLNGSLIISTDGAWKKLASTSILKPFRFYLTISSREGSPVEIEDEAMSRVRIRVMGEEDYATGIDEVNTENANVKTAVYDLSGRRVNAPAKGGVYIINGKKVIY